MSKDLTVEQPDGKTIILTAQKDGEVAAIVEALENHNCKVVCVEDHPEWPTLELPPSAAAWLYTLHGDHLNEIVRRHTPAPKRLRECLLPSCTVQHRHNGGYCCAEHCKKHRGDK